MDTRGVVTEAFGRVKEWVHRALADLPEDGINYQPDQGSNSIGWLVWHLARVQDDHIAHLAGRNQAYSADGWAARLGLRADDGDLGYGHTPEQVAEVRFESAGELLAYYDAVHDRTQQYVDTISAEELDRVIDTNWDPPVTAGVRLVSVVDDCMNHTGQAHYVRGLWERLQS